MASDINVDEKLLDLQDAFDAIIEIIKEEAERRKQVPASTDANILAYIDDQIDHYFKNSHFHNFILEDFYEFTLSETEQKHFERKAELAAKKRNKNRNKNKRRAGRNL